MVEVRSCWKVIENREGEQTPHRIVGTGVHTNGWPLKNQETTSNLKPRVRCTRNSPKYIAFVSCWGENVIGCRIATQPHCDTLRLDTKS